MQSGASSNILAACGAVRRAVRRYRLGLACVSACAIVVLAGAFLDGIDRLTPLREGWTFVVLTVALGLGLFVLLLQWVRALTRGPTPPAVALAVEQERPEFMDSLVCAVEVARKPPGDRRLLERLLLARVDERIGDGAVIREVFRRHLPHGRLLVLALCFGVGGGVLLRSPPVRKAYYHFRDLQRGRPTGIVLSLPDGPVAERSDVRIDARVTRWEPRASIVYEDGEGMHRFPMNQAPGNAAHFTFYDVRAPIRFKVVTPSLTTKWQRISTYRPPRFEEIEMAVRAPAYTRREPLVYPEFKDCATVEGGTLSLTIKSAPEVTATFRTASTSAPFRRSAAGRLVHTRRVDEDLSFQVDLRTPEGWTASGPPTTVRADPDLPPAIGVVRPRRDLQLKRTQTASSEVRATDDFGISEIRVAFSISGGPRREAVLFTRKGQEEPTLDESAIQDWDLGSLAVKEGDVISYLFTALDNREPERQMCRSDVQFIIVRPDLDQQEMDGEGRKQEKKLDVGPLIAELKRLIRYTWDLLGAPSPEQVDMRGQLSRDLKDLRLEVRKIFNQIAAASGGDGGPLGQLLEDADLEIEEAISLVAKELAEESLPPQERALAKLVALENELLKNAVKSKKGEGGDQGEEGKKKEEQEEAGKKSDRQQKLNALKKALDRVRQLSQQQDRLNQTVRKEQGSGGGELGKALAEKQEDIRERTTDLEKELARLAEAARSARELNSAAREMRQGGKALARDRLKAGEQHGMRAHRLLQAAAQSLQDAYRQAAANDIARLAAAAQQLADAQQQAARETKQFAQKPPPAQQLKRSRERQEQLRTQTDRLRNAGEQTAGELEDTYPEAAKALAQAAAGMRKDGISRTMKRAANALLYKRFDRARKEQTDAANRLQNLAGHLQDSSKYLPAVSREELLAAMQELRQRSRRAQEAMAGDEKQGTEKLEKLRERTVRDLDGLAAALQDPRMQSVADDMSMPLAGANLADNGRQLVGMFQAALRVLEKHLLASEMKRRVELSRETSEPPEKYRRLVERYFRELSRER